MNLFDKEPQLKLRSEAAISLYMYLKEHAGKGMVMGQHTQTLAQEEVSHIKTLTGKEPKLRGYELLAYSPNIHLENASEACATEVIEARKTIEDAMSWMKAQLPEDGVYNPETCGILTFTWHWFSPIGGEDKSFYAEHTDFDPEKVLENGSKEQLAFDHDMDVIADVLRPFQDAKIPILWRPFHESEGTWFWWGRKGIEVASKLYQRMYDHFVSDLHFDNLLWVWNGNSPLGYPGDEYCDLISADIYLPEGEQHSEYADTYEKLRKEVSSTKLCALAEVGHIPDVSFLAKSHIPWAYFMTWSKEFILTERFNLDEVIKANYQNPYAITL